MPFSGPLPRWLAHSRLLLMARHLATASRSPGELRIPRPEDPADEALRRQREDEYVRVLHAEGESRERFARGMAELERLSRGNGVPVAIAILPLFPDGEADGYSLADVHGLVREEARRHGFHVLDLEPAYAAARRHFGRNLRIDYLHPDPLGHRVAAGALLRWLCDSDLLPAGALPCSPPRSPGADAEIAALLASGELLGR